MEMVEEDTLVNLREYIVKRYPNKYEKDMCYTPVPKDVKTYIDKTTFEGYNGLETLVIDNESNVCMIDKGSFESCKNITTFHFSTLYPFKIDKETLIGLENISTLSIYDLEYFTVDAFSNMKYIHHFTFYGGPDKFFNVDYIKHSKSLITLYISGNVNYFTQEETFWTYFPNLRSLQIQWFKKDNINQIKNNIKGYGEALHKNKDFNLSIISKKGENEFLLIIKKEGILIHLRIDNEDII